MGVLNPVPLNTLIKIYSNLVVHMIYLTIGVWNRIRWFGSWYVDRNNSITFHAWYLLIYIIYHGSVIKKTYIFSSPELKAQVSFSDHLSSVVCLSVSLSVRLSVNFSHFHLLLQNHWTNFNQTWHKAFLGEGDSSLFKWSAPPISKWR